MLKEIERLKNIALNDDGEKSVNSIEELIRISNSISEILIDVLVKSKDKFTTSEKISTHFENYISKLESFLEFGNKDLSFYSASLIVHYKINNNSAEQILLNTVLYGELEKAYTATTLLSRFDSIKLRPVILTRLKESSLTNEARIFFESWLKD